MNRCQLPHTQQVRSHHTMHAPSRSGPYLLWYHPSVTDAVRGHGHVTRCGAAGDAPALARPPATTLSAPTTLVTPLSTERFFPFCVFVLDGRRRPWAMHAPLVLCSVQGPSSAPLRSGPTSAWEVVYLLPGAGRADICARHHQRGGLTRSVIPSPGGQIFARPFVSV
jgi:hypothetical protein